MIPAEPLVRHPAPPRWQQCLREAVTDPRELAALLDLGHGWADSAHEAARRFPLRVPRGYLARIAPREPGDPLLRQVLPLDAECAEVEGFGSDPVGDLHALAGQGIIHKYLGRALLVVTGACAIHCRYCFRREFPYAEQHAGRGEFAAALDSIRADPRIEEVLLSGGDPLTLGDRRLGELLRGLDSIGHVRRVRVHTRLPVVLPERIDAGFVATWQSPRRLQRIMVIHANHAREIAGPTDAHRDVQRALRALRESGCTLLNQSVLLRGVNDDVDVLAELSESLFAHGVLPYYLHLLDRVRGAAHFEVPEDASRGLYAGLLRRLPGYLVPRLVRETPGAGSKTLVAPA
jgi:EF-P beta-lysylation protein EpmB